MITSVFFDFDGVMTLDATGSQSICNYICRETGIDSDLFKEEYKKFNDDLLYGKINHKDIWKKLCSRINKDIDIQILNDSFINTPIDNQMVDLVKALKNKKYKTAMVTDNKKDRIDSIVKYYYLDKVFDAITVSADIGSGKDHEEIFVKTMQGLNVKSNECVFIDNQEKNLIVPEKLGMKVIHFDHEKRDTDKLVRQLSYLGVITGTEL